MDPFNNPDVLVFIPGSRRLGLSERHQAHTEHKSLLDLIKELRVEILELQDQVRPKRRRLS
jgi:hypothetical protein